MNGSLSDQPEVVALITVWTEGRPGMKVPLQMGQTLSIGRDINNALALTNDRWASRNHCQVTCEAGRITLLDSGSANGTFVEGKRLASGVPVELSVPCWFIAGRTRLLVTLSESVAEETMPAGETHTDEDASVPSPFRRVVKERTQPLLVTDVIGSTSVIKENEEFLVRVVSTIGAYLESVLWNQQDSFIQCTGDGFLACFENADSALNCAKALGQHVRNSLETNVRLSHALHWGQVLVTSTGDVSGRNVHGVFSLERVRREEPEIQDFLQKEHSKDIIVLSEEFITQLTDWNADQASCVGTKTLKGAGDVQVYYLI